MSSETLAKYVAKPATAFAVGSVIGAYVRPSLTVPVFGTRIPAWVLAGLVCAIGSEASALLHDYVMPHVMDLTLLNRPAETAAAVAVSAGTGALAYNTLVPGSLKEIGVTELITAALAAEVISGYATEMWWKPMLQQYA